MLDRTFKRICLAAIASFILAVNANAQQISTPNGSELNYGSAYCLPTQNLSGFTELSIFGQAFDVANQSTGAKVKWTVFKLPTFDGPGGTKIFSSTGTSVGTIGVSNTDPSNPWTQACIVNTVTPSNGGTGNTVLFFLEQVPQ